MSFWKKNEEVKIDEFGENENQFCKSTGDSTNEENTNLTPEKIIENGKKIYEMGKIILGWFKKIPKKRYIEVDKLEIIDGKYIKEWFCKFNPPVLSNITNVVTYPTKEILSEVGLKLKKDVDVKQYLILMILEQLDIDKYKMINFQLVNFQHINSNLETLLLEKKGYLVIK